MDKAMNEQTAYDLADHRASSRLHVLILKDDPRDVELCIQEMNKVGFEHVDAADNEGEHGELKGAKLPRALARACASPVPKVCRNPMFMPLGSALSEKQIPQII
jgi:hypothetical protein